MRFGSVCSGIEAASCAWQPLGWRAAFVSEIESFPSAVLAHHYPDVPNLGDMTKFKEWPHAAIDVLVGGTPCQSFSVAGLRKGLADPRGNLMLTYLAIADRYRPRWLVWENVPGVLSSGEGRDFGAFLGGLGQLGYGFAYRVLDAQFFGVPQRRRRVFVVGCLGDWRRSAAVLFERHSLQGNPAPRREAGQEVAGTFTARTKSGGWGQDPNLAAGGYMQPWPASVAPTLDAHYGDKMGLENQHINSGGGYSLPAVAMCLNAGAMGRQDAESETLIPTIGGGFDVVDTLTSNGDAHSGFRDEKGLVPIAFGGQMSTPHWQHGISDTLQAKNPKAVACSVADTLGVGANQTTGFKTDVAAVGMQVRRLTPRECERLQGFEDDYTLIPVKGKPAADGPRYKALGNSMAVPVMAWIGERIATVDALTVAEAA